MDPIFKTYIFLLVIGCVITLYLAYYAWNRRNTTGASTFAALEVATFIWLITSVIDWIVPYEPAKILLNKLGYIGVTLVPVTWLLLALDFAQIKKYKNLKTVSALCIVPCFSLVMVFTGRFWDSITFSPVGEFLKQETVVTIWFWLHIAYSYVLYLTGTILIIRSILSSPNLVRAQALALLIGATVPFLINILYVFKIDPLGLNIDFTPLGIMISGIAFGIGLFRYQLFWLVPLARSALVDTISDSMIALDHEGYIVDLNTSASRLFSYTMLLPHARAHARQIIPELFEHIPALPVRAEQNLTLKIKRRNQSLSFDVKLHPLWTQDGIYRGLMITFHDITERLEMLEQLRSANEEMEQRVFERTQQLQKTNLQLQNEISERIEAQNRLDLLYTTNLDLTRSLDLNTVLQSFLDDLRKLVDYYAAHVLLLEGGDTLVCYASRVNGGNSPDQEDPIFIIDGSSWLQDLASSFTPIVAPDQNGIPKPEYRPGGERAISYLAIPLVSNHTLLGMFALSRQKPDAFTDKDQHLGLMLATSASIAIQNALLYEEVRQGRQRMQLLSNRLVEVQEAERYHIANELHDQIGQLLTGLQFSLEKCKRVSEPEKDVQINNTQAIVSDLVAQVRSLSLELRPKMLDDLGLLHTLLWYFDHVANTLNVEVDFKTSGLDVRFRPELETTAYRIIQEALTNIARHAHVNQARVRIDADGESMSIRISDHGVGFDVEKTRLLSRTVGLAGMNERAVLIGGKLIIRSSPDSGTRIEALLPIRAPQPGD